MQHTARATAAPLVGTRWTLRLHDERDNGGFLRLKVLRQATDLTVRSSTAAGVTPVIDAYEGSTDYNQWMLSAAFGISLGACRE